MKQISMEINEQYSESAEKSELVFLDEEVNIKNNENIKKTKKENKANTENKTKIAKKIKPEFPFEKDISVCFTGHRFLKNLTTNVFDQSKIKEQLKTALIEVIKEGYSVFMTGMAIGSDLILAQCIIELKERFVHLKLVGVIPCLDQAEKWGKEDQEKYANIYNKLDKAIILNEKYSSGCMFERNKYMVDNSDIVVAIWNYTCAGGTFNTIKEAKKASKRILNFNFKMGRFQELDFMKEKNN